MLKDLSSIKQLINNYLLDKKQLESIDETLIDELIFNIEMAEQCKSDMRDKDGKLIYQINTTTNARKKAYWVKSQAFVAYQCCLKNINTILISLGLTIKERAHLKSEIEEGEDEIAKLNNKYAK